MSFRRRHRWTRRILLGLAVGVIAAPAQARPFEGASIRGEAVKTQTAAPPVISYLSHGLTAADVNPVTIPDAFERAVVSLAAEPTVISYLSQGLGPEDALDPRTGIPLSAGIPVAGDEFVAMDTNPTTYTIIPGQSWYLVTDAAPARPDDRVDRFVVGAGTPASTTADDGFTLDWQNGITVGLGALVLALALGLAVAYMRRPRVAL